MLFLQPLYEYIFHTYATRVNHFALIKLILYSLDKTLFYFIIFVIIRLCWLLFIRHRRTLKSEACVWIFAFYVILLLMLTVFRDTYFPWQLTFNFHRDLGEINLVFMKETIKLTHGQSLLDFFYNSLGNVLWFIPFGLLFPEVIQKNKMGVTVIVGACLSVCIEGLQFILETGVSDIDDVFFNVCGAIIGFIIYKIIYRFLIRKNSSFMKK
ncbi:VanZ family protein [Lactobacillus taiwanensis]|uniref:VanZ family protein n=1 Tax=Lactobacillus taiwanensis TaxID=508451 RepID=UPI000B9851C6|nr:VanZ family protein [Lactobacillus taiwanensis]OYR97454.1 VanZ family protein [Lactobacillus taiwanensis]OYS01965.1 VanZ family protein [Lactobacillus taiwanensis]OYS14833.1 VanZ family protein [Lactobacillus taiwanensis]OYS32103.1 VanZ family protein [Lactobacillus taiwanensis]OYS33606.1 VanZ family protein [Lactobacillus taiwanensis]